MSPTTVDRDDGGCACGECVCSQAGSPDNQGLCHECAQGWHESTRLGDLGGEA